MKSWRANIYSRKLIERDVEGRVEELDELVSSLCHDLRAPLASIEGLANLCKNSIDTHDGLNEMESSVDRISSLARTMMRLVEDLFDFSLMGLVEIRTEVLGLQDIVEEAISQVGIEKHRADIRIVEGDLPLTVYAHRPTLVAAIVNLLSNAIKFCQPGCNPKVRIHAEARNDRVRLWVEDEGIGIAPSDMEKVFRIMMRLHGNDEYPGTGIGLAIVRRAMERMGGRTGVESKLGEGSRFWIELKSIAAFEHCKVTP